MEQQSPPCIITFAGAVGSSKTPIANHLSWNISLPVFNTDAIRSEVKEDILASDEEEHRRRRGVRLEQLLGRKRDCIIDASIDREWKDFRPKVLGLGYRVFIISLDLSQEFLQKLYQAKGYDESATHLPTLIAQHDTFVQTFPHDISLHITDQEFPDRLTIALTAVKKWLETEGRPA